ncbi:MAG: 30S ribosome-binding factor RbfA [bacterium]|nr:30S ribosome-binding factor RbfA [bacterium]
MPFKRSSQVGQQMKRELSGIIASQLKDPRLGFVTITDVELADDLRYAKVFISIYGDQAKQKQTLNGLKSAKGYIRRELGQRLQLRNCPDFDFRIDESIAQGDKIDHLLNQIAKEKKPDADQ